MTRNDLRVRDRFTFTLTGMPGAGSYASVPVISSDRIRKSDGASLKRSRKTQNAEAGVPHPIHAVQGEGP